MQPILVPIPGKESGDRWILTGAWDGKVNHTGPWRYDFRIHGKSYRLEIPFMFDKLDGASVPRAVDGLVRMGGRETPDEAWIPHDFIYHHKGRMPFMSLMVFEGGTWQEVKKVTRKFADSVFHNELRSEYHSLASFKPILAYAGVRLAFWKKF